eukprot:scaffold131465_cov16-Tisochrysis_lutea.AAC.2
MRHRAEKLASLRVFQKWRGSLTTAHIPPWMDCILHHPLYSSFLISVAGFWITGSVPVSAYASGKFASLLDKIGIE